MKTTLVLLMVSTVVAAGRCLAAEASLVSNDAKRAEPSREYRSVETLVRSPADRRKQFAEFQREGGSIHSFSQQKTNEDGAIVRRWEISKLPTSDTAPVDFPPECRYVKIIEASKDRECWAVKILAESPQNLRRQYKEWQEKEWAVLRASRWLTNEDGALTQTLFLSPLQANTHAASRSALRFNGLDQHVRIPGFFTNAPTTEVTVEFWQKASSLKAESSFCQDDSQRDGFDASNVFNAHVPYHDQRIYWDFGNIRTGGRLWYVADESIIGSWQHFAFVASQRGNFMRIYRNGVLEAERANMTPLAGGPFDLNIGGETYVPVSFGGMLDEFRIWKVARTQAEIQATMCESLTLPQEGLMAYWRFDEGEGDVAHDASGQDRDGILVNGPQWVYPDARNLWIEADWTNGVAGYLLWFTARDTAPMLHTVWDFGDGTRITNRYRVSHAWRTPGSYTVRLTGYDNAHPDGVNATVDVHVRSALLR